MRNISLVLILIICFAACSKKSSTDNYINKDDRTAYVIEGLMDMTLSTDNSQANMELTIKYTDSLQRRVHIYVTGLPDGVTMDSNWTNTGYPTFSTTLTLYDSNFYSPAKPGNYTVTINVEDETGSIRKFPFGVNIVQPVLCAYRFAGPYHDCTDAASLLSYADSAYLDTNCANRIWFGNFAGTDKTVMCMARNITIGSTHKVQFIIPYQVVGGIEFYGNGEASSDSTHNIEFNTKAGSLFYYIYMK